MIPAVLALILTIGQDTVGQDARAQNPAGQDAIGQVAAGQVLAWIDSPELGAAQAEYRQAVSMLRLYEAEYERASHTVSETGDLVNCKS